MKSLPNINANLITAAAIGLLLNVLFVIFWIKVSLSNPGHHSARELLIANTAIALLCIAANVDLAYILNREIRKTNR